MQPVNFPGAREIGKPPIAVFTVDEEGKCNDAG